MIMEHEAIDVIGQVFGRLTAIERVTSNSKGAAMFLCQCECGNTKVVSGYSLRYGETKSCGCLQKDIVRQMHEKDLTGQTVGSLYVVGFAGYKDYPSGRKKLYHVRCECGTEKDIIGSLLTRKNHVQSCGCMTSEIITEKKVIDLTGQVFGRLTVLGPERTKSGDYGWRCLCECGNEIVANGSHLKDGHTLSCGCYHKDISRKDITGQKFGMLTVLDIAYSDGNNVHWNCVCDCGTHCVVNGANLRDGAAVSCGCLRSTGENFIKSFLEDHAIKYYREKKFNQCKDRGLLKFDFWLPDYGMCIEYDGEQHYYNVQAWDKSSTFEDRKRRDAIKNIYCEKNGIVLLRIPYWEKQN